MQKSMLRRFLLALPLLTLAQCTSTNAARQVSAASPAPADVQQQIPQPPSKEQLEFFNYALDLA